MSTTSLIRDISFAGKWLSDFGVFPDFSKAFNTPEYSVSSESIPGKNGNLLRGENRFENKRLTIPCLIKKNFKRNFDDLVDFLTSSSGTYQRLEITAKPGVYRMAAFYTAINPETGPFLRWGKFDLVFDCMPQQFLKVGENKIDYSDAIVTSLMNPTLKPSRPLLIVEPTTNDGSITINAQVIRIRANNYRFYIDCELMHAYRLNTNNEAVSMDAYVTMPDDYVQLMPGENRISTNDAAMAIVPRWWRL